MANNDDYTILGNQITISSLLPAPRNNDSIRVFKF